MSTGLREKQQDEQHSVNLEAIKRAGKDKPTLLFDNPRKMEEGRCGLEETARTRQLAFRRLACTRPSSSQISPSSDIAQLLHFNVKLSRCPPILSQTTHETGPLSCSLRNSPLPGPRSVHLTSSLHGYPLIAVSSSSPPANTSGLSSSGLNTLTTPSSPPLMTNLPSLDTAHE